MLDTIAMPVDDWIKVGSGIGAIVIAWLGWKRGERARIETPPVIMPSSDARALTEAVERLARATEKSNAAEAIDRLARATEASYAAQREEDQFARFAERMRVVPAVVVPKARRYSRPKR